MGPRDEQKKRAVDEFHNFPFSSDEAFQHGLSGILGHESTRRLPDSERSDLILKTKIFYFNRYLILVTGHNVGLMDLQAGRTADREDFPAQSGNEHNQSLREAGHGEARTLTFTELKSLIEQGKTGDIPNNKIIPNTLNDTIPSASIAPLRKKPWEVSNRS